MNMEEGIKLTGKILIELRGPDGKLKDRREVQNIVTNTGRQAIIDRLQGSTPAAAAFIAIGTGATAAAAADTTLQTEVARSASAASLTQPDAYTDRCIDTFAAGTGTGTITEAGRFTANSGGTMMGRQVFTGVVKTASDSLQITYDFTYVAS
jgi:hypothetical protein